MKITKEEDYAILFMTVLAISRPKLLSLQEISDNFDLPYYFLKKIARQLKENRLVNAKEGAAGGYSLALPAQEINLADIIEAIRGPEALSHCAESQCCLADELCIADKRLKKVSQEVRSVFSSVKLTDMIGSKSTEKST